MPWGLAAVAGAGLLGAGISANAASGAANTEAGAANNATALQQQIYNTNLGNEAPFLQTGTAANNLLGQYLGLGTNNGSAGAGNFGSLLQPFTAAQFQTQPGYQFQLQQGEQALQKQATTGEGALGGNAAEGVQNFVQGTAQQDYQQQFNNYLTQQNALYSRLSGGASLGQNAASMSGNFGTTFGSQAGSNTIGAGNAIAAGQVGSANALTGALGGLGNNALLFSLLGGSGGLGGFSTNPYTGMTNPLSQQAGFVTQMNGP